MGTKYTYSEGATYQSESTPITISNIPTGEYKIKAVSGDLEGEYSYTAGPGTQSVVLTTKPTVYGFRIAVNNSDPYARVTYPASIFGKSNGAYGKTPASGTGANCMNDWDGCPLISGIHRQLGNATDGWTNIPNTAPWQAGSGFKDMMTYVPTWYMKMTNDGTNIDCAFSKTKIDDTWEDYAGSVGSNRVGHFRVGCFAGIRNKNSNGYYSLFSLGNLTPNTNYSITDFINLAQMRGTGYDIMTWYQWTYLTALAVLLYKSTNLQSAMGRGYVSGTSVQTESSLAWSNNYGMYGSTSSNTEQMSFFWIQNLWGNMHQFVGGAKTDSSRRLMTCTGYSSVTDSDFDNTALTASKSSNLSGYLSKIATRADFAPSEYQDIITHIGFFPSEASGSSSTYFSDMTGVHKSTVPYVGGNRESVDYAGPFYVSFYTNTTGTNSNTGSRLSYRL